jgi:glyoxylase-like metal-dependent hydrolase (beta-lactamase superfamily II)
VTGAALEFLPQDPPAPGDGVELASELRWLRLPVPGPLQHINVWLVPAGRGRVLIDSGMNEPGTHAAWERLSVGEDLRRQLSAILVTHHHPDHLGMAAALAARFGVSVVMSAPTHAAAQSGLVPGDTRVALAAYQAAWGVDFAALVERANAAGAYARLVSGLPVPARFLGEGETPPEFRDPWRVSLHFGHAEGHACLHWPEGGLFISGDQLLPSISSNVSLYPGTEASDPLGDYLASLERLGQLPDETLVLPAHGQPFRGAALRAAQLRRGHAQRLERLTDFTAQPRSTEAVVGELFGARNLQGWNSVLAYGETLAHISHLLLRGGLQRIAHADGSIHWVRS